MTLVIYGRASPGDKFVNVLEPTKPEGYTHKEGLSSGGGPVQRPFVQKEATSRARGGHDRYFVTWNNTVLGH